MPRDEPPLGVAPVLRGPRRGGFTGVLAAVLLIAGIFGAGIGLGQATGTLHLPSFFGGSGSKAPPGKFPVLGPSKPLRIIIPSIGVRAPIHSVGLDAAGTIAVPAVTLRNEAGWYEQGPTPGQYGPAIMVGHVDTKDKPAVFARLGELKAGARIEITRRDRQVTVFEVNSVEWFGKTNIPTKRIYDDYSRPGLRLITCGGRWVGGELGYASNVVVFASLVSTHKA
ncbi:hypothetical protein F4553_003240 [Allocatelliglobosispora scoriae]|uniref:Class F sortase n=1 Tax=Allocatelliglobosispora scoriae TaxID=643052 RepID=A0A841BST0_9ACTN|nr:class F sortase [Allocatelliglobosispora scoriae]MBB5869861.1 hypothetical protein [Allocatelliglobosispora scoriae]